MEKASIMRKGCGMDPRIPPWERVMGWIPGSHPWRDPAFPPPLGWRPAVWRLSRFISQIPFPFLLQACPTSFSVRGGTFSRRSIPLTTTLFFSLTGALKTILEFLLYPSFSDIRMGSVGEPVDQWDQCWPFPTSQIFLGCPPGGFTSVDPTEPLVRGQGRLRARSHGINVLLVRLRLGKREEKSNGILESAPWLWGNNSLPTKGMNTRIVGKLWAQGGNLGSASWSRERGIVSSTQPWPAAQFASQETPIQGIFSQKLPNLRDQPFGETFPKNIPNKLWDEEGWRGPGMVGTEPCLGLAEVGQVHGSGPTWTFWIPLIPTFQDSPASGRSWRWAR